MKLRPWAGCSLPGADDFIELGRVDLDTLDVYGLLALARYIGIVPIGHDKKGHTTEVLRKAIEEHAMSA
jgi:hypothetical protein